MFVMLVGPSDDIIESKIVTGPNLKLQNGGGGLEPPGPNAIYAPTAGWVKSHIQSNTTQGKASQPHVCVL